MKYLISLIFSLVTFPYLHSAKIYTTDLYRIDKPKQIAVLSLQGFANREKPQAFVNPGKTGCFSKEGEYYEQPLNILSTGVNAISDATKEKFPHLEDVWIDYYSRKYNLGFENLSYSDFVGKFISLVKGVVIYDEKNPATDIPVAVTYAAQHNCLPVTKELYTSDPHIRKLPVKEDLRKRNFKTKTDAYNWLTEKYLHKSNKTMAYSYWNAEHNYFTVDMAIARKLFAFDLSYANEKIYKDENKTFEYSIPESGLLDKIFSHLNPCSSILGWGEPNEFILQARCGSGGHVLLCTNVSPNLSFHSIITPAYTAYKQRRSQSLCDSVKLEQKIYVTFSMNEGDTYKCLGNLMNDGAWLQEQRGKLPYNWPCNPRIFGMLPGLAEYYYDSMTTFDYFYIPTSGVGYYDSSFSSDKQRSVYASEIRKAAQNTDMHYMDIWWNEFPGSDEWLASMNLKGIFKWKSHEQVNYSKPFIQIDSDIYYPKYKNPSELAEYIKTQGDEAGVPWFIHVYGVTPQFAYEVAALLPDSKYKVVCADEFFTAAAQAEPYLHNKKIDKKEK